jgi:hypothetical protein
MGEMFSDIIVINLINSVSTAHLGDLHYACLEADLDGVLKEANESCRDGAGHFQHQSVGQHDQPFADPVNIQIIIHLLYGASCLGAVTRRAAAQQSARRRDPSAAALRGRRLVWDSRYAGEFAHMTT